MEVWKEVKDYEGIYEVSSYGRVKSLPRECHKVGGKRIVPEKVLTITKVRDYCYVKLSGSHKKSNCTVHRLVAIAFVTNLENKKCVNHINGIKDDNRHENLEWTSQKENIIHAWETGLSSANFGESNGSSILDESKVLDIRSSDLPNNELAEKYEVSIECIRRVKRRNTWKHI